MNVDPTAPDRYSLPAFARELLFATGHSRSCWTELTSPLAGGQRALDDRLLKGGDPAAPSGTATLLRLHPSYQAHLIRLRPGEGFGQRLGVHQIQVV